MTRIALFGGSFNPIHIGHLWMAQTMREALLVDQVLFMPTGDSPHKGEMLSAEHRARMVELACEENPGFVCSRYEVEKDEPSYTVRTIEHLMKVYPDAKIDLLIGQDSFLSFHTWREYQTLLKMVKLVVVPRVTDHLLSIQEQYDKLVAEGGRIHFLPMPVIQLSATDIRDRVRNGRTIKNRVPDSVKSYIEAHHLYEDKEWRSLRLKLKASLSPARYEHSLRVSEYAVQLARVHGVDEQKAGLTGLLHDCAKGIEDQVLQDPEIAGAFLHHSEARALWHTELGPLVAASEYGVTDPEVLRAIRSHTTAIHPMSPLDQIIYLADKLEPGRHDPENVGYRNTAKTSLARAFYEVMEASVRYLHTKGLPVHENTNIVLKNIQKGE